MLKKILMQTARILFSARTSGTPPWETQGLLARTIQYFWVRDIFGRKFTSSAEEPLVTYPNQTSSRNVRICPTDWPEKYFSGQSVKRSMQATLLPSYTKSFSSLIGMCNQKIPTESFRKKCNKAKEIAHHNIGARKQHSSNNFHSRLMEGISLILTANLHDFYTVVFGDVVVKN